MIGDSEQNQDLSISHYIFRVMKVCLLFWTFLLRIVNAEASFRADINESCAMVQFGIPTLHYNVHFLKLTV